MIEAAVVLPLFICAMVFLMFHFRVLQVQMAVEEALSYTSRFLAASAFRDDEGSDTDLMDLSAATVMFRLKLSEYGCPEDFIAFGANGISLINSRLDENDIELSAIYDMNVPVSVFGLKYYRICQSAVSRKWIGDKDFSKDKESEEWVYITPTGSAYHRDTKCPYLDLSIRSVSANDVWRLRNKNGHKYYKCELCKNAIGTGGVYVTDYGEVYHSSLGCSGLKRTVYMVRLSEVTDRHACSKCG